MTTDRRSWLDRLLNRQAKLTPGEIEFEPAGSTLNGVDIPISFAIVPGDQAIELLHGLHKERQNQHAFILGNAEQFEQSFVSFDDMPSADEMLTSSQVLTIESWQAREAEYFKKLIADHPEWGDLENTGPERGEWPDGYGPQTGFTGHIDILSGDYKEQVFIGLSPAPVTNWWETAAHMKFGGWNDCPPADVHVMLHKTWAEKYGARLMTMSFDTIELAIEKPIVNKEEALEVAGLQYKYCNDGIDQGAGTLENLAASLVGATSWFFWWD